MPLLFPLIFLLVYLLFGLELGYTATSPWWTHLTYSFQHATPIHLLMNSISFYLLFRTLQRHIKPLRIITIAFTTAVAVSFLYHYPLPVVGASGIIYALIGIYLALILPYRKHTNPHHRRHLYIFVASVALFLTLSFLRENSAGMLHLLSLAGGFVVQMIFFFFDKKTEAYHHGHASAH